MDLHRRRSVLVRMTEDGWKLATARFTNSAAALRAGLARAGENPGSSLRRRYGEQGGGHAGGPLGRGCAWRIRFLPRNPTGLSKRCEHNTLTIRDSRCAYKCSCSS